MKFKFFILLCLLVFFVSCQTSDNGEKQTEQVILINHNRPMIKFDNSPFMSDCFSEGSIRCEEYEATFEEGFNGFLLDPLLGGLEPVYPSAMYVIKLEPDTYREDCIYSQHGPFFSWCYRFVFFNNGVFEIVKTFEEFRTIFAPVESPEEALGFALVTGDYYAKYNHRLMSDFVYYVDELEDSHVRTTEDGYIVHLFTMRLINCEQLITDAVDIKVTIDGQVEKIKRYPVYRDPDYDGICV